MKAEVVLWVADLVTHCHDKIFATKSKNNGNESDLYKFITKALYKSLSTINNLWKTEINVI